MTVMDSCTAVHYSPHRGSVLGILAMLRGFPMTFIDALIASGYVFDDENFDECYVKHDPDECVFHCYQQHEEEGLWNYVKMTDGLFDVITEVTFDPNVNTIKEGF